MNGKKRISIWLALVALLLGLPVLAQSGGGYDLRWSTVDGGGGFWGGGQANVAHYIRLVPFVWAAYAATIYSPRRTILPGLPSSLTPGAGRCSR